MFTPGHAILNLALLHRISNRHYWPVLIGAILPDLPIIFLFLWEYYIRHTPFNTITSERYFDPVWQNIIDGFNSLPAILGALLLAILLKKPWFKLLLLSMAFHVIFDFPLHTEDAHRHFLPFSEFRFRSPVSYWNINEYGMYIAFLELVTVAISSFYLAKRIHSRLGQILLFITTILYVVGYAHFFILPTL